MRFEVPQFIEVEDKIVGPFTWKQFIYLAGGTGMLLILYFTLPFLFFVILGVPLGSLAGFLAFHRINNRPFSIFLESIVSYFSHTRLYLWNRSEQQSIIGYSDDHESPTMTQIERKNINALAKKLELNTLDPNHDN